MSSITMEVMNIGNAMWHLADNVTMKVSEAVILCIEGDGVEGGSDDDGLKAAGWAGE